MSDREFGGELHPSPTTTMDFELDDVFANGSARKGADDLSLPKGIFAFLLPYVHPPPSPGFRLTPSATIATVQKIINEILASPDSETSIAFGKDARDLLIDCCVEFITLISSEANEIAEKESKKTIATEHIDRALRELGFPEYVREVLASAGEMKESLKVRQMALV